MFYIRAFTPIIYSTDTRNTLGCNMLSLTPPLRRLWPSLLTTTAESINGNRRQSNITSSTKNNKQIYFADVFVAQNVLPLSISLSRSLQRLPQWIFQFRTSLCSLAHRMPVAWTSISGGYRYRITPATNVRVSLIFIKFPLITSTLRMRAHIHCKQRLSFGETRIDIKMEIPFETHDIL